MTQNTSPSVVGVREKLYLLGGGCLLGVCGLLLAAHSLRFNIAPRTLSSNAPESSRVCSEIVQPKAALSREQLSQLMSVPERSPRSKVQEILKEPYCRLVSLNIRAGVTTERESYPLAFDPQTSLVIVYEGDTYVGYGFKGS